MDENITITLTPAQAWALVQEAQKGREAARGIYTARGTNAITRELYAAKWTALSEAIGLITGIQQRTVLEPEQPRHTVRGGKDAREHGGYGVTHDMDCPGCEGTSFTSSPRSETYWSS